MNYIQTSSSKVKIASTNKGINEKMGKAAFPISQGITMVVSVVTVLLSIYSFHSNQFMVDKRKYHNQYYDEKYNVLKELTKSTSQISNTFGFRNNSRKKLSNQELETLSEKSHVFNYALLVLNPRNSDDSAVLSFIDSFKLEMSEFVLLSKKRNLATLRSIGDSIAIRCGRIINNEKDSINSYKPTLFGFLKPGD